MFQKQLKEIDSRIHEKEAVCQQMKTIKTFQKEHKSVKGSLKSLKAEFASLQEKFEKGNLNEEFGVCPISSSQKTEYLVEELILLKANGDDLSLVSENLDKMRRLNEQVAEIGLAVESLKKNWKGVLSAQRH